MDLLLKYNNCKIHFGSFPQDKCFIKLVTQFKIVLFGKRPILRKLSEMGKKYLF